ncbi:nucleic acid-binding protein [Methanoculleus sp. FWC-SCC1]|uniref:Nucleic acid-binding protein n=1 Tax=Methanoculleus frigidifontis TaxID=2584085 RepID=A0ABT8MD90_9EURY|nr:nucleic acid-binding protein [Methanoculleus sp. FWC-SCC1]MDN7025914.1 nucleic acid-binding protein [Methanoculleus sp. FWC-SCC1]
MNRRQISYEREPARRVFASEFRETRVQFKASDDEKSPNYALLPSGVRANRILVVGTLTEKQRQGDQNIFYRGRIIDPTGTFFIMAGSYQPEAMQQIAKIEVPAFVAVIGKPNIYQTPEGAYLVSINAESISTVDRETRDIWVLDTARETLDRLDAIGTTDDSRKAQEEYGIKPEIYRKMVYDALTQVQL